ncbi:MAG TPA: DUF5916 domain-containing protein [Gemmatimonadaceae bacterium]|nr:DUF5916 domain-containing protein [Gemmatimonadaceae bacterium]
MIRYALCLCALAATAALGQNADTLVGPGSSTAAARPTPVLQATRLGGEIRIDGRLDEAAWTTAEASSSFTQSWPNADAPPTERTEVRVLYDEAALYVGVRLFDSAPDSIASQLARRDASGIFSDWVHVVIDSYHDRRSGFRFTVNPHGVPKDVYHFNDGNEDLNWDAVWQVGTTIDSLGWTAEYRIPFSQIRFSGAEPMGGRVWGLQVQRDIARKEERTSWSPWSRNDAGYVSRFGQLTGLVGINPVRRMELQPYVSGRLTRAPGEEANPFYDDNATKLNAGVDVKLGLTAGLTLTGTVNPDFGQVEVDPAVVNLSAFESFFSEKRPFFVEGADIFRFGDVRSFNNYNFEEYFYSRRIGRSPQRSLGGAGITYTDAPRQSTILGAVKVSGKTGPWTVGLQNAVTARERGRFIDDQGVERSASVEPQTNYFVGRVRRDLNRSRSVVGGILTATHRDMSDPAFRDLLHSRAFLGGLDFEHGWADRKYIVSGYVARTLVESGESVIGATQNAPARYYARPDADHLEFDPTRTSLSGNMYEIALQRSGDFHWSLDYKQSDPGFEINDLGFHGRVDYRALTTLVGRRYNEPRGIFRTKGVFAYTYHAWNTGGDIILNGGAIGGDLSFRNFWSTGGRIGYRPSGYDDRLTRGGPIGRDPEYHEVSAYLNTDPRKSLSFGSEVYYSGDASQAWSANYFVYADFRPSTAVRLRLSPGLSRSYGTGQYVTAVADPTAVETFGTRYIFADIDRTTLSMTTRLDWTFSPTLSLELFAQPFIASGDYLKLKEFETPGEYDFAVYGEDRGTVVRGQSCASTAAGTDYIIDPDGAGPAACFSVRDRDFNQRSLRGNAVLRWEYRPGSTLFFVWQQQRDAFAPTGTFDFRHDAGELFRAPSTNVFLVKATYWISR